MMRMHEEFPVYDFATHKGYCTKEHQQALDEHGPCPQHRRRFVNVRRASGIEEPDPMGGFEGEWALDDNADTSPTQLGMPS
jgi:ribonuclease HII